MSLFRNIVLTAVVAGLLSGLLLTVMQSLSTVPLILQAEVFENAAPGAGHSHSHEAVPSAGAAAPSHEHHHEGAWTPADGLERFLYTAAANMLSGIGFALVFVAVCEAMGGLNNWRSGLLFGIAGFVAVVLAPGLGLPPELPGMPAAELGPRQVWWIATAACTAVSLGLLAYSHSAVLAVLAILLLIAPHLVGAPLPPSHETAVPMDLEARFVNAVFATNLVFWAVLGTLAALVRAKFRSGEEAAANAAPGLVSR
ncbi:cobalt transporter [Rhizobium deserti]|uniref:Cobalt transporter n=1 Tax=Rhizobium deserti TaxID=2547961 RepID=A0A4R5U7G9_9HYPH|nr:CbtA family protein [Rhizobium deserti]TDK30307.1 cobalt transporter [Rhizobium deserti]